MRLTTALILAMTLAQLCPALGMADEFDEIDLFSHYKHVLKAHSPQQIEQQNREQLEALTSAPASTRSPQMHRAKPRIAEVDKALAEEILRTVENHPIASLQHYSKYDPDNQGIGFCFGRAMTVDLEARSYRGVLKESVKKIWALGNLQDGKTNWRYHVTTIIKGPGNTWWALDPIMQYVAPYPAWGAGHVITVEEWYQKMKNAYDKDGTMKIYFTSSRKFGPSSGKYSPDSLYDEFYNGYFVDLLEHYRNYRDEAESSVLAK